MNEHIDSPDGQPRAVVARDGVRFTLLGTAHVSRASVDAVEAAVASGDYDAIAVELDLNRHRAMTDPDALAKLDLFQIIREGKIGLVAANLALAAYQRRLAAQLGVEPGAELKAAAVGASERGLTLHLIDRDVGTTLKRAWSSLGFWGRSKLMAGLSAGLFVAACVTDWFDGYFARRYHQISRFGRFLDPIADKLLVAAALVMLVNSGQLSGIHVLAALIILAREILVSGLREFLAELRVGVPVSQLAKWKTAVQMGAIAFLLLGDAVPPIVGQLGLVLIWIAAALTLITGYDYLRMGMRHMAEGGPT